MKQYLKEFNVAFSSVSAREIKKAIKLLKNTNGRVYLIGNGGSSAIASHFANDLNKIAHIPAICLSDNVPTFSAYANDVGYAHVFSEQLKLFIRPPDLLIVISSSGNSPNIINAAKIAKRTVAFVGFRGGKLGKVDSKIHVRSDDYGIVESVHDTITHYITRQLSK